MKSLPWSTRIVRGYPDNAELYRRKVARLSEALDHPDDRHEAMDAIRQLVSRVVLTPGAKRGEVHDVPHGDSVAIADWVSAGPDKSQKGHQITHPAQDFSRVSESVESRV